MRRFFISEPLAQTMFITSADAHHICRVLRLRPGDTILVTDQNGQAGVAEITQFCNDGVALCLRERINSQGEPPIAVWLVQGLVKGEKMDFIVQKAVELGVTGIIPVITEHCVVKYDHAKQVERVTRWQKIAREASKQCGRMFVPEVSPIIQLSELLKGPRLNSAIPIMLYEGQAAQGLKQVLSGSSNADYLLMIGPEGGFSPVEVQLCQQQGVHIATMGSRILRTETAALAALAAVMYQCGDLGG